MNFEKMLREEMNKRGFNQKELAEFLGLTQPAISRYLQGSKPNHKAYNHIMERLGIEFVEEKTGKYKWKVRGHSTENDLRECLEYYPGISQDDIDEIVGLVKMKVKHSKAQVERAANKSGSAA